MILLISIEEYIVKEGIHIEGSNQISKKFTKMEMKYWRWYVIAQLVISAISVGKGLAQAQDTSCLNQLAPCLNYLNGTRDPPESCCDPLKSVIKSKPECLCSLISNNGTKKAEQAGINVNEAQELPGRCGQHVNPISCLSSSPDAKNSVPDSASVILSPSQSFIRVAFLSVAIPIVWGSYTLY